MKRIKAITFLLLCCLFSSVKAQTLYPMTANSSVTITDCSGLIMDSGSSTANYSANETSTLTICTSIAGASPVITFNLAQFDIPVGDILNIYNGPTTASSLIGSLDNSSTTSSVNGSNSCITLEFISDGVTEGSGWQAQLSCAVPCQTIVATTPQATPSIINPGNEVHLCLGDSIHLTGSGLYPDNGTFYTQNDNLSIFEWDIDDDGIADYTGQNLDLLFNLPQGNRINLLITDTNNCTSSNVLNLFIMVSTPPTFYGLSLASDTICFLDSNLFKIDSVASNPWAQSYGNAVADTTALPDQPGLIFTSSVLLNNFGAGQTLNNINDLNEICLDLEHSYLGDLEIEIVCPSGQSVFLLNNPNLGGNTFLGEPVDNDAPGYIQGVGYTYCFSNTPTFGTMSAEASTFPPQTYSYIDNNGVSVVNQSYLPAGTYQSENPLSGLVGCQLNGTWSINIIDNASFDNGAIFSWYIDFNSAIFPSQLWGYDPGINTSNWITDNEVVTNYGDSILVAPSINGGDVAYTYTITDNFGCTYDSTLNFYVTPSSDPNCRICFPPQVSSISNLCNGDSTGILVVIPSDSLNISPPPYTITWLDASLNIIATNTTNNIDSLLHMPAGNYLVQIEDSNNCIPSPAQTQITLSQPTNLSTFMIGNNDISCAGNCDGFAEVNNQGGTTPYAYLWENNDATPFNNTLCKGISKVTVTDFLGCTDTLTVTINSPPLITVTINGYDTICQTQVGYLAVTAQGGNAGFSYFWNTLSSNDTIYISPAIPTDYTVIATDALGCTESTSTSVTIRSFISVTIPSTDTICNGDSTYIKALTTGGDGNYTFQWTNGISSANVLGISPVSDATYFTTITDGCGSPTVIKRVDVLVGQYPIYVMYPPSISKGCSPLNVEFLIDSVKSNRNYTWSFGDGTQLVSNTKNVGHLYSNTGCNDVSLNVTTNLGCSIDTTIYCAIEVYPNPIADFILTNYRLNNITSTTTVLDQSYLPDFWQWNFGDGESSNNQNVQHTYKDSGNFTIRLAVETVNGCKDTTELTIYVGFETLIYVPNSFSPNNDGLNDLFLPYGDGLEENGYLLTIFNRWGQVIFKTASISEGWDGTIDYGITAAETGVYTFRLEYVRNGDFEKSIVNGPITLIR